MYLKTLIEMYPGEEGIVKNINGGWGIIRRLYCMGIFPGQKIKKLSGIGRGGPVIIEVMRSRVAIGHGMAAKIIVETYEKK